MWRGLDVSIVSRVSGIRLLQHLCQVGLDRLLVGFLVVVIASVGHLCFVSPVAAAADTPPPEKLRTDLSRALRGVLEETPAEELAGIAVLTDGRHNAGDPVPPLARRIAASGILPGGDGYSYRIGGQYEQLIAASGEMALLTAIALAASTAAPFGSTVESSLMASVIGTLPISGGS